MARFTVGQTLDYIRSRLGEGEHPAGSNCNDFSHALDHPCEPWCADFATYVMKHCGVLDVKGSPAARYLAQQFKDAGRWVSSPKPGDLAFFIWAGDTEIHHVEFVEAVRDTSPLDLVDIGGNVGNKVARVARRSHIVGYGRPAYAAGKPPPTKPHKNELPDWYRRELSNRSPMLHGHDVEVVQRKVGATPDGKYGPKTAARVKTWQRAHHVKPYDGIVGKITAKAMG